MWGNEVRAERETCSRVNFRVHTATQLHTRGEAKIQKELASCLLLTSSPLARIFSNATHPLYTF